MFCRLEKFDGHLYHGWGGLMFGMLIRLYLGDVYWGGGGGAYVQQAIKRILQYTHNIAITCC